MGYDKQNSICFGCEGVMFEIEVCFLDEIFFFCLFCFCYMQVMDERFYELGDKMKFIINIFMNINV